MKITMPMTFEIDDDHPVVQAAVEQAAARKAAELDAQVDGPRCCPQCDEPLTDEQISPLGADFDDMCEDCHLEHVNPREWARRHPGEGVSG